LHCDKQEDEIFHLRNLSLRPGNRAFFQVFSNEGNNLFQNTSIYKIIRGHFPGENNNCGYFLTKLFTPVCQLLY